MNTSAHRGRADASDRAVDALAIAIALLLQYNYLAEAWELYALSPEPGRLAMRLRCHLTATGHRPQPSRRSRPAQPPQG